MMALTAAQAMDFDFRQEMMESSVLRSELDELRRRYAADMKVSQASGPRRRNRQISARRKKSMAESDKGLTLGKT